MIGSVVQSLRERISPPNYPTYLVRKEKVGDWARDIVDTLDEGGLEEVADLSEEAYEHEVLTYTEPEVAAYNLGLAGRKAYHMSEDAPEYDMLKGSIVEGIELANEDFPEIGDDISDRAIQGFQDYGFHDVEGHI